MNSTPSYRHIRDQRSRVRLITPIAMDMALFKCFGNLGIKNQPCLPTGQMWHGRESFLQDTKTKNVDWVLGRCVLQVVRQISWSWGIKTHFWKVSLFEIKIYWFTVIVYTNKVLVLKMGNAHGIKHFLWRSCKSLDSCVPLSIKWPCVKSGLVGSWINMKHKIKSGI